MIATFLQLNHRPTVITPLPARLLGRLEQTIGVLVFRAFIRPMPLPITKTADLGFAATARPKLLPMLFVDILGFYPFPTMLSWTIDSILGGIFLEFSIPRSLKIIIKQFVHMFQGYMIGGAAFWRHMLWVSNREPE